jgi:hypothetical protein
VAAPDSLGTEIPDRAEQPQSDHLVYPATAISVVKSAALVVDGKRASSESAE